jgi:hypothetical protein
VEFDFSRLRTRKLWSDHEKHPQAVPFQPSQTIDEKRALTVTARIFAVIATKLVEMEKRENWVPEKYA